MGELEYDQWGERIKPRAVETYVVKKRGLSVRKIMIAIAIVATALYFALISLALLLFLGVPFLILLGFGLRTIFERRLSTHQNGLASVLVLAAEKNAPLAPAIEAYAELCSGKYRVRARDLAERLADGELLPRALAEIPSILPVDDQLLIRVAFYRGDLSATLRGLLVRGKRFSETLGSIAGENSYLFFLFFVVLSVYEFTAKFLVPKYVTIIESFHIPIPFVLEKLSALDSSFVNVPVLDLVRFGLAAALLIALFGRLFGFWRRGIPILRGLITRSDTLLIVRSLAIVAAANRPLSDAIDVLSRSFPKRSVRRRLESALERIEAGGDWLDALLSKSLITRDDHRLLDSARRAGNLEWALKELADQGRRRLERRNRSIAAVVNVFAIMTAGGIIFMLALAYYYPLVVLIQRMANL
jgi:type II secretory pathway component PulF